ncbi:ABC transporter G family member 37 [Hordeum vulgare]|nr:ABC transporter G family member 37 [Hordeum vulgare]
MSSKRMNIALLAKWLWRIANGVGGLWLDIIKSKYLRGQPLAFCQRSILPSRFGGSQFWQSVIQLLRVLRIGSSISIGSSSATLFWFDRWSESVVAVRFPVLFSIAVEPRTLVEVALLDLGCVAFHRPFELPELAPRDEMLECIALHSPYADTAADRMSWCLEPSARFSARSLYRAIAPSSATEALTNVWGIRLPLKIRIFMWQWIRGRVPSGVEVLKRNGPEEGICPLCDVLDSNHIFFTCSLLNSYGVASVKPSAVNGPIPMSETCLQRCNPSPRRPATLDG